MSQSPVGKLTAQNTRKYRQGWQALNQLLHEGKSFSGNERNCAFLNLGGRSFADVSGLVGFDFAEDARSIVSTDWDFDGDLDLWITARTAPRLRFLRNNHVPHEAKFLSVLLTGNGRDVNRDAIGARAELYLEGKSTPLTRSVTAGDAFLSQNTRWLTFPLDTNDRIHRLIIFWPGGNTQTLSSIGPGHYQIKQNQAPYRWASPPPGDEVVPQRALQSPSDTPIRIVLTGRLPLPSIQELYEGTPRPLPFEQLKGPLVLNLWAPWCAPCVSELTTWTRAEETFRNASLRMLAANTDATAIAAAQRTLRRLQFPFESTTIAPPSVRSLDWFQRSFLDHWAPLPIPSSFLIDTDGNVAVIYKGKVSPKTLIRDLALLGKSPNERRNAAIPFNGIWLTQPREPNPILVNAQFVAHDELPRGLDYLQHFIELEEPRANRSLESLTQVYATLGTLWSKTGQHSQAEPYLRKALQATPTDRSLRHQLATTLLHSKEPTDYREAIAILRSPDARMTTDRDTLRLLSEAYLKEAQSLEQEQHYDAAEQSYRQSLKLRPSQVRAAERLGWLFATRTNGTQTHRADAQAIAERLCALTNFKNADYLDLLSVAQAANGRFDEAIQTALAAQEFRTPETQASRFRDAAKRIELFKQAKVPSR